MIKSLDEVNVGSKIKVKAIAKEAHIRRRLMDLGIIPGVEVEVIGKAPLGDPIEIGVRGYKLTLRKSEAMSIGVE